MQATGEPGWHFIDLYPAIYNGKETRAFNYRLPQLTYADDHPGEDLPAFDTVVIPWGGGGLTTGIASAVKALRPGTRVVAVEPASAAPLTASLAAGSPAEIDFQPSFVDGAGGRALLPTMWDRAHGLVDAAVAVPVDEVADAVRILATRARVVAEGAGALALAAARRGDAGEGKVVCVVSGGNIDAAVLSSILRGETP